MPTENLSAMGEQLPGLPPLPFGYDDPGTVDTEVRTFYTTDQMRAYARQHAAGLEARIKGLEEQVEFLSARREKLSDELRRLGRDVGGM